MKGRYDGEGLGMVGGKNTIPNPSHLPFHHGARRDEAQTSNDEARANCSMVRLKRSVAIV